MAGPRRKKTAGRGDAGAASLPPMPPPGTDRPAALPEPPAGATVVGSLVPTFAPISATGRNALSEFFLDAGRDGQVVETEQASLQPQEGGGDLERVLIFRLGGENYGMGIMGIREILKPLDLTEVPRAPEHVLGVFSLRGHVMPVLSLTGILGVQGEARGGGPEARFLVVGRGDDSVAFWVHRVAHVVKMDTARLEPPPVGLSTARRTLLRGLGKAEDGLVIVLDLGTLMTHLGLTSPDAQHEEAE